MTEIPKDVFVFDKKSEIPLDVCLYNNPKLTKFDGQAFTQMGRPVTLDFSGERFISGSFKNQLPVLEEKVFLPFLKANELNNIEMKGQQIDCTDCRNAWIKKDPKLTERVVNGMCADGLPIKGGNHFANCK